MFKGFCRIAQFSLIFLNLAASASAGDSVIAVTDVTGRPVANAVVWFASPQDGKRAPGHVADRVVVDQIDKQFVPQLTVIPTGTEVAFPNSDSVSHHVYSFAQPNNFELPLYRGGETPVIRFDHAGIVTLGCNIHDSMLGYIVVLSDAEFAVSDGKGLAHFAQLPPAESEIQIWSPRFDVTRPIQAQRIDSTGTQLSVRVPLSLQPSPEVSKGSLSWEDY